MKISKATGVVTALVLSVTVLLAGCGDGTTGKISSQDDSSSVVSDTSSTAEEKENPNSSVSEPESSSVSSSVSDTPSSSTDKEAQVSSKPDNQPGASSKPSGGGNTSKPSNSGKPSNGGSSNKPSNPGNSTSSGSGSSSKPAESEKPTEPSVHTHNFVDVGVKSMDWTYSQEPGYSGPTNTREKVSAINACLSCGCYFGNEENFADRFAEHVFGPNASCGGAYSLRTVYACYHLLECSTPGCHAYRRGALDHYEYLIYFNGNGNAPTSFTLEEWQIKELGLPMP